MTAKNQNFEMIAGDSHIIVVPVNFDLSGATAIKWAVKRSVSSTERPIYKELSSGITVTKTGETDSEFQITLNPSDTATLKSDYYHEAEVTDAQGNVSTVMTGRISIQLSGV
jgi:hypothetical protein